MRRRAKVTHLRFLSKTILALVDTGKRNLSTASLLLSTDAASAHTKALRRALMVPHEEQVVPQQNHSLHTQQLALNRKDCSRRLRQLQEMAVMEHAAADDGGFCVWNFVS